MSVVVSQNETFQLSNNLTQSAWKMAIWLKQCLPGMCLCVF